MRHMMASFEHQAAFDLRRNPKRRPAVIGGWMADSPARCDAGVMVSGHRLEPPATATTVRFQDGARRVQDRPFADTEERLGGYFIIGVPDLDAALGWAARCPAASYGAVEVRPVLYQGERQS